VEGGLMPATVTAAITAITAQQIVGFIVRTVIAIAISSVFSKKPKSSASDFGSVARDQQVTANNPVASTRVIYGDTLVGGTPVFLHRTDITADNLDYAAENHRAAATVTVERNAQFREHVKVQYRDLIRGGEDEAFTPMTEVSSAPAVGEYSRAGGVYTFNADDWGRSIQIEYRYQFSTRVVGRYLHLVIEFAGHEVHEIGDIWFDDEIIPLDGGGNATGRFSGHVYVSKHLGSPDQTADTSLIAAAPDKWTADHRLRGRAYIYVRLTKNPDLFPNGIPNIRARVKGKKVYDPRSTLTAWSANAALCTADYLTAAEGLAASYATEIDEDLLIAAANVCDEDVTLAGGGTEKRYTCNGAFLTAEQPKDVLGKLKVAMAGHIINSGGRWGVYAGAWRAPDVTLTEDDLRGSAKVTPRISRRELFNGVKGVYSSPGNAWQPADFPAVTNATYLAEDQGQSNWLDVDLQFTHSAATAQRLAKIELERVRQQISVILPCKLSALRVRPPDVVGLTLAKFGWTAKPFEVIGCKIVVDRGEDGAPYIGVDLVLRETASGVYDWASGEETTVDLAPDTLLPNPFTVIPPGAPVVVEEQYATTGSAGVKSRALVSVAINNDADVVQWGIEYRVAGSAAWVRRAPVRGFPDVLDDLAPARYEFRARAFNRLGVGSAYSPTTVAEILGLSDAPADVSGFSVIKTAGVALAQWAQHPALDVQINGVISVRHSPLTTGATWQDGVIVEEFPGGVISGLMPLITGTYMAKARDSSGNWSVNAVSFVATEGLVTGFTTVATSTQHTAFAGAKTNVALDVDAGGIKLDSTVTVGGMVTPVSSWPRLSSLGGISGTGSYAFDATMDLTTVATRRFESDIKALSYDNDDLISNRLAPISEWNSISGGVVNDCDVTLYARTTNDNPAGSPTWGAWTPFFVADFTCRALQFKLDFASGNPSHNILVTELAVASKIPA
jgi:hypothetical protein